MASRTWVVAGVEPPPDGPGHHVTRRQLGVGVLPDHEPLAAGVDQHRPGAAQRLGEQWHRVEGRAHGGGMELDELRVGDACSGADRHRQAVAGHLRGVGGVGVQPADAPGGEHHRRRQDRLVVAGCGADRYPHHDAPRAQQVHGMGLLPHLDVGAGEHCGTERAHQLCSGGIAVGVDDAVAGVARLTPQHQLAAAIPVEPRPVVDQPRQPLRGCPGDQLGDHGVR